MSNLSLTALKSLTETSLGEITSDDWRKACRLVKEREREYWRRDGLMDEEIERIVINIGVTSSEEECTASSSESYDESTTDTADEQNTNDSNETDTAEEPTKGSSTDTADETCVAGVSGVQCLRS